MRVLVDLCGAALVVEDGETGLTSRELKDDCRLDRGAIELLSAPKSRVVGRSTRDRDRDESPGRK